MTRILIQQPQGPHEISGVSTYVALLAETLGTREDLDVRTLCTKGASFSTVARNAAWADVIHLNSNHLVLALLGRLGRRRVVIKAHYLFYQSTHHHFAASGFRGRLRTELGHVVGRRRETGSVYVAETIVRLVARLVTFRLAHVRLACSAFLAAAIEWPSPVHVHRNPVAARTDVGHPTGPDANPAPAERRILFAGRVDRDKGVFTLVEGFSRVLTTHAARLLIVGDGPDHEGLQKISHDLGLAGHVEFLGRLDHDATLARMAEADVVVVPSEWSEAAGYVALEALACGTRLVVSDAGGLPEEAGPTSLTFRAGDAHDLAEKLVATLDTTPSEAETDAIQQHLSRYSPDRVGDDFLRHAGLAT